ncbi:MAG: ParB/RepB/Spo0J family partition protein, partial [Firmicutes bacterium]|nr:ParB/RepB/Spo0J family partition protein [Bacillota bacterium]
MSRTIAGKIKINSFADIVGGDDSAVTEVPLSDLHTFKDHPFRVLDDEKMEETVESIKERGVLMPGIVRPRIGGGYEIIAGHRRKRACELAGLKTMPVVIRKYTDEEAVVAMVDTNLQREEILPSEKARAYRMKYDAMKHQGSEGGNT